MKKTIIILVLFLMSVYGVSAATLPFLEHECYSKYSDKAISYSFILDKSTPKSVNGTNIIIHSPEEMCRYASDPQKCYECIVRGRYGLNDTAPGIQQDNKSNFKMTNPEIVLSILAIILAIFLFYTLRSKSKHLKSKNKVNYNGKFKRGD